MVSISIFISFSSVEELLDNTDNKRQKLKFTTMCNVDYMHITQLKLQKKIKKGDITLQHIARMSMQCSVISPFYFCSFSCVICVQSINVIVNFLVFAFYICCFIIVIVIIHIIYLLCLPVIWGSQDFEIGSGVPGRAHLGVKIEVHIQEGSVLLLHLLPNLKQIGPVIQKL